MTATTTTLAIATVSAHDTFEYLPPVYAVTHFNTPIALQHALRTRYFDVVIIQDTTSTEACFTLAAQAAKYNINTCCHYILIVEPPIARYTQRFMQSAVAAIYSAAQRNELLQHLARYATLYAHDQQPTTSTPSCHYTARISYTKRALDIIISSSLLLCAAPIMACVALVLKLESRGPIIYRSRRTVANFNIIDVYKFRTMVVNADQQLDAIKELNAYKTQVPAAVTVVADKSMLYDDTLQPIDEATYLHELHNTPIFLKFKADPRVTKFGRLLRMTSIDELPQLFNILRGEMSIVGNRPLPIAEGDRLTTDETVARFLAPAGLTGYWQVTQRGTAKISQRDRIRMDNVYATKRCMRFDLKIIKKTFQALLQHENH